jgi:hypothetical protein
MLGHFDGSEKALCRAREGFLTRKLAYEVAVVSHDLAQLYATWGQAEKLERTVNDTVAALSTMPKPPEAQAVLDQLGRMTAR